jgi:soluble lytic murein transglycosylase-like protein
MSLVIYRLFLLFILLCFFSCGDLAKEIKEEDNSKTENIEQDSLNVEEIQEKTLFRPRPMAINRISQYDKIIKKYSRRFGFDWRLVAAQIFAESRFISDAKSRVGAVGLMQIMPSTAKHMGLDPKLLLKPEQNISVGCLYDRRLYDRWKNKKGQDRLAFTLASFNAGRSRVLRAESRAGVRSWQGVKPQLPRETQNYVTKIFNKYETYKKKYF